MLATNSTTSFTERKRQRRASSRSDNCRFWCINSIDNNSKTVARLCIGRRRRFRAASGKPRFIQLSEWPQERLVRLYGAPTCLYFRFQWTFTRSSRSAACNVKTGYSAEDESNGDFLQYFFFFSSLRRITASSSLISSAFNSGRKGARWTELVSLGEFIIIVNSRREKSCDDKRRVRTASWKCSFYAWKIMAQRVETLNCLQFFAFFIFLA